MTDTTVVSAPASKPVTPADELVRAKEMAVRINAEYAAILSDQRENSHKTVERAIKVGLSLRTCKSKVGHGNWLKWVKENCPAMSKSTVERWMKLAEAKAEVEAEMQKRAGENVTVTHLSLREALKIADGGPSATPNASDAYDSAQKALVKKLKKLVDADTADAAMAQTIKALQEAVDAMRAEAKPKAAA
jgi:hypothetical protein